MVSQNILDEEFIDIQPAGEGQNVIKACLFNLIVIANTLERALYCQDLLRIIIEKYPCRIIFVRIDDTAQTDLLRTSKNIYQIGSGSTRVTCDQFSIEVSSNQIHKVPFLILPNIVPDLPVYLLLGHDPSLDIDFVKQVSSYANRIIFDAESIENFSRFSQRILGALEHDKNVFIDINWARTKAWREVISRVFNDQAKIELLKKCKNIVISYSSKLSTLDPKYSIQAIYIQSWLAAQLNWNFVSIDKEGGALRITYRCQEAPITVSIIPHDSPVVDPGALYSIEVESFNDTHYLISHESASRYVTVHSSNIERCEMPFSLYLNNFQRGTSLVGEIFYQPPSEHYHKMLQMLVHQQWSKNIFA